jgi:hypothetical protein
MRRGAADSETLLVTAVCVFVTEAAGCLGLELIIGGGVARRAFSSSASTRPGLNHITATLATPMRAVK